MYHVFIRCWYKQNPITKRLEPNPHARKTTIDYVNTQEQARAMCQQYNSTHPEGKLSRKAEYTSRY